MRYLNYSIVDYSIHDRWQFHEISTIAVCQERLKSWKQHYPELLKILSERRLFEDVVYSHRIEGMYDDESRLEYLTINRNIKRNRNEKKILGLYDATTYVESLIDVPELKTEHLTELHKILTSEYNPDAGLLRKKNNIHVGYGSATEILKPAEVSEVEYVIDHLFRRFNENISQKNSKPHLISICASLDYLAISPFEVGNGRIYRIILYFLLRRTGLGFLKYESLNKHLFFDRNKHLEAIGRSTRGWGSDKQDYSPFIDNILYNLSKCCEELELMIPPPHMGKLSKSERLQYVVENIEGRFTREEVEYRAPDISRIYIQKELAKMVDSGKLIKIGRTKDTEYLYPQPESDKNRTVR